MLPNGIRYCRVTVSLILDNLARIVPGKSFRHSHGFFKVCAEIPIEISNNAASHRDTHPKYIDENENFIFEMFRKVMRI